MAASAEERAMLRAVRVRQAMLGVQNGVLRVVFVALAILKVWLDALVTPVYTHTYTRSRRRFACLLACSSIHPLPHTQLDGRIHVTWWAVFTPLWLFFAGQFLGICVERSLAARVKDSLAEAAVAAGRDPEAPLPAEEEVGGLA